MRGNKQAIFCSFTVHANGVKGKSAWIGRERKRGKIEDLNSFLTGQGAADILREGSFGDLSVCDHFGRRYCAAS